MIACDLFQTGFTHLNRRETKFAKEIDKIAKITWRSLRLGGYRVQTQNFNLSRMKKIKIRRKQ
jgi:hypothetical protein